MKKTWHHGPLFFFFFFFSDTGKKKRAINPCIPPCRLLHTAALACISVYYQSTCYHFVITRVFTTPFGIGIGIGIATSAKFFTGIWSSLTQGKTLSNSSYFVRYSLFCVCMYVWQKYLIFRRQADKWKDCVHSLLCMCINHTNGDSWLWPWLWGWMNDAHPLALPIPEPGAEKDPVTHHHTVLYCTVPYCM